MSQPPTERTRVRRSAKRGIYDKETVYAIVDAAYVGTVAYAAAGKVRQIPMAIWREGDALYIHGSTASGLMRDLAAGAEACIAVTHLDGLVLARSAFHHSMNYRSVVLYGKGREVVEAEAKERALDAFMNHLTPGRLSEVRPPTAQELKGTMVLAFPLDEASAKIRTGGPIDDEEDYKLPVWAGQVPLKLVTGEPLPDDRLKSGTATPAYLEGLPHEREAALSTT
ncbi:MAG: pyridoxamine 5'-phosphate oxidase family protein [Acidobacteriota bacterium]|nr:pyridoxamine 5'-phosphate oxidase family protein [Acidobacteriota bacterium]